MYTQVGGSTEIASVVYSVFQTLATIYTYELVKV